MKLEGSSIARICRHLPAFAVRSAGDVGPFYSWAKGWDHNSGDGKTYLLFIILFFQFLWWGQSNQKLLKEDLCRALWEVSIFLQYLEDESWWPILWESLQDQQMAWNCCRPNACQKSRASPGTGRELAFASWMLSRCIVALGKICPLCLLRTHSLLGVQCLSLAIAHSFLRVSIPFLPHSGSKEFACSRGIIPVVSQGAHSAFGLSADSIQWSPVTKWKLLYVLSEAWYLFQCVFVLKLLLACFC